MKKSKNFTALGICAAILSALIISPSAEAGGRIPSTVPQFGLYLQESFDLNIEPDNFWANADNSDSNKILRCKGVDDPICTAATTVMTIHNLPTCQVDDSFDCIKSLWAIDSTGKKIEGKYLTALPLNSDGDHDAIASMKLSAARGLGGLWQIPGVINSGGEDRYFVSARMNSWHQKSAGTPLRKTVVYYGQFMTGIVPVKALSGGFTPMISRPTWGIQGAVGNTGPTTAPDGRRCTVTDINLCQLPEEFPAGYRFGMSVQLAQRVSGWFHGRIALPNISITPSKVGQLISIEAEPVKISTLDFMIPNSQIPAKVRDEIFADVDWGIMGDPKVGMQTMLNGLDDPKTMDIMTQMLPVIGDKATKTTQYWSYRALNAWNQPDVRRCSESTNQVGGVVTTNSLTYSSGPPAYNPQTGTLDYKVASPHYQSDGKVAIGTYDLAIKSDVARCIYGFSSAPISASISILNDSGEQKLATTVVNEKNGWLYMSAKGFTFSSPTIRVKLSQSGVITCVKGKTTKIVKGKNPKCPYGFKAK